MNQMTPNRGESSVELLKQIQVDCRRAKIELKELSSIFGERESAAVKQLRSALNGTVQLANQSGELNLMGKPPAEVTAVANHRRRPSGGSPAPLLEIYFLGKFEVRVRWNMVERWNSQKAKSLMKYLLGYSGGHPVPKEAIMENLWPTMEPRKANNNLKVTICALKQTLGSASGINDKFAWVVFRDGSYAMNSEIELWTDVDEFEQHRQKARKLEMDGNLSEAIKDYEAAEALYKGDYLEDDLYEEWTWLRRETLKENYLTTCGKLADYSMQNADHEGCIFYCQKILMKDFCREDAYRRLMRCHSRLGQRNKAISWYRVCERIIKRELEVNPDPSTIALYHKLLCSEAI